MSPILDIWDFKRYLSLPWEKEERKIGHLENQSNISHTLLFSTERVWVRAPKWECQKYSNESVKIFPQRAENQGHIFFFWRYQHLGTVVFGALVIFWQYCKKIILALSFWHSMPAYTKSRTFWIRGSLPFPRFLKPLKSKFWGKTTLNLLCVVVVTQFFKSGKLFSN